MKLAEPIFLIAYPLTIKESYLKDITLSDDKLVLPAEEKYFFKKELHGKWDFIQTFAISDTCPLIYLLDKNGCFWIYDVKSEKVERVKHIGGIGEEIGKFLQPKDILIWKNIIYVIDKNRLQAFSLVTWQVLWVAGPQRDNYNQLLGGFSPISLAVDDLGNTYVLDSSDNRVLKFNLAGKLIHILWAGELVNPVSLSMRNNTLYLLESKQIRKVGEENPITLPEMIVSPVTISINSKEKIYVGSDQKDEDEGCLWGLNPKGELINTVVTYKKACKKMLFDKKDNLWVLDTDGVLSLIVAEKIYQASGKIAHIFDSTIPACEWHKLVIDGEIPEGTSLDIDIIAKDEIEKDIKSIEDVESIMDNGISLPSNPKDIFLADIKGRYLVVKIKVQSDPQKKNSPILSFMKVYFPRETYLRYLPAIYQEDKESKDILERYLSIYQTILENIEKSIEKTHLLIDPATAKGEFLNWLSAWVGLIREERWSDEKWSKLLSRAMEFFKMRGTREGLSKLIELYTGEKPIIIEPFQLECNKEKPLKLGNFSFCVILKPGQIKNDEELQAVKRIIKLWRPAHTEGKSVLLKERMLLGEILYLGINTYLNQPSKFVLGKAVLPIDTRISGIEDSAQIESHARLGIDTKIKY